MKHIVYQNIDWTPESIAIDDVLNAADMAVGNPEFLDLDMEGMF
jgi:hypothetical protein